MTASEFRGWLATLAEAQATIPAAEVLRRLPDGADSPHQARDMPLEQVASEVGRAVSTVRTWLNSERLTGYKLNGRDWRIPQAALRKFLDAQQGREATGNQVQNGEAEWNDWRQQHNA